MDVTVVVTEDESRRTATHWVDLLGASVRVVRAERGCGYNTCLRTLLAHPRVGDAALALVVHVSAPLTEPLRPHCFYTLPGSVPITPPLPSGVQMFSAPLMAHLHAENISGVGCA